MFGRLIFSLVAVALGVISPGVDAETPVGTSTDIGTVGFSDGFSAGGLGGVGDWTVYGAGLNIWGSHDNFHFLHFNHTGDVTVTCLVRDFTGATNVWRKGGIMFRNNLGQRSAHSMIQVTGWGIAHQTRAAQNHHTSSIHNSYSINNIWLRLVKKGNTVTSFVKRSGEYEFMKYGSNEVDLGESYYVGLAVASSNNEELGILEVRNFEISDDVYSRSDEPHEIGDTGSSIWVQEYGKDQWRIKAAGSAGEGIGGTADSFGFFDQEQTGDIVASLHLEKLTRRNSHSKGGLMIRASHDVDAPHVSLLVNANDGITMFARSTIGGTTTSKNVGVWAEDVELRLEKTGNSVKCMYKHADATEWYVIGTETAEFGTNTDTYYVGQALSSADYRQHAELTTGVLMVEAAAAA